MFGGELYLVYIIHFVKKILKKFTPLGGPLLNMMLRLYKFKVYTSKHISSTGGEGVHVMYGGEKYLLHVYIYICIYTFMYDFVRD